MSKKERNYTIFYTEKFDKYLCDCDGIVNLSMNDRFMDKEGNVYEVIFKLFNVAKMVMIYHGKPITKN